MKYPHSIERSMEYFRMALPLMTKQATGVHPISYAIWYEYVSAENPGLRTAVDQHLAEHSQLDSAATETLYRRHIADLDAETVDHMAQDLTRTLDGMAGSAQSTSGHTARYQDSLKRLSTHLGPASKMQPEVQTALHDTHAMQQAIATLQGQLEESGREIAALRDEVRRVRQESLVDSLTGLPNRRAFDQRMAAVVALADAGTGSPPCLITADIDHFKQINDRYGHSFGDQVLRAVAKVLEDQVPEHGLAARIGGEEFALLLPNTSLQAGLVLAEKVRTTIGNARVRRAGQADLQARISLSLGLAAWQTGDDAQRFFDRADKAMYDAKAQGRDRVVLARR